MLPLTYYELAKIVCLPVLRLSIEHPHHHRDHPHHQWHHYHHHQHDKGSIFSGSDWIWGQRWGKESDSSFRCHLSNDLLLTLHLKHLFLWSCRPSHFNICSLLILFAPDNWYINLITDIIYYSLGVTNPLGKFLLENETQFLVFKFTWTKKSTA